MAGSAMSRRYYAEFNQRMRIRPDRFECGRQEALEKNHARALGHDSATRTTMLHARLSSLVKRDRRTPGGPMMGHRGAGTEPPSTVASIVAGDAPESLGVQPPNSNEGAAAVRPPRAMSLPPPAPPSLTKSRSMQPTETPIARLDLLDLGAKRHA